eukprot:jgi/Bigna1/70395/fgenesh1_pg.12_\
MMRPLSSKYEHLLDWLLHVNRGRQVKLGLQNMKDMQRLLGFRYTDRDFGSFHVAGTNGKGSVCWKLAKAMESVGLRVGLFSSPHISSFRERISVNGEAITEKDIEMLLPPVIETCAENDIPATFFELTTILSMGYFNMKQVDFAVYEVGLGGRLDSTNVLSPDVSVITSISLDHTQILGDTIEEIAQEKGGIIKNGTPIVTGPNCPHHVLKEIAARHGRQNSRESCYVEVPPRVMVGNDDLKCYEHAATVNNPVNDDDNGDKECDYNAENYDIALMALRQKFPEIDEKKVERALCGENRSGNNKVEVVLDVAHNEDAFRKLFAKVKKKYPRATGSLSHDCSSSSSSYYHVTTVMGLSSTKDVNSCIKHILKATDRVFFVNATSERARAASDLLSYALEKNMQGKAAVIEDGDVTQTLKSVTATSPQGDHFNNRREVIIICGSFFIMKEARAALNIPQIIDSFDLNERFKDRNVATSIKD